MWQVTLCAASAAMVTYWVQIASIVAAPATPESADTAFRAAVRKLATARHVHVNAWGTMHLDGSDRPYRVATLAADTIFDGLDHLSCRDVKTCAAGYIVEESATRYWYIATSPYAIVIPEDSASEPPWDVRTETWIQHDENHNHGKEYVAFGLRGGRFVVLDDEDYNSRFDASKDPDYDPVRDDIHHRYARDGKKTPPLAGYRFRGITLKLVGPASTIAALPTVTL